MKLALEFFDSIEEQLIHILKEEGLEDKIFGLRDNLEIAALLHDVGHAPFSHLGEQFYKKDEIKKELLEENSKLQNKLDNLVIEEIIKSGSSHECMSCYCILKKFRDILGSNENLDIEFIFRIITGYKYKNEWYLNLIIGIVNSNTVDVDKLDYLLRDNHMTGYPAPKIDVKRLLNSLFIDDSKELTFKAKGIASIQSLIDSRDSLYLWVYNHHTAVYTDYLITELLRHFIDIKDKSLNLSNGLIWEDFFSCKAITEYLVADGNVHNHLNEAYKTFLNGTSSKYSKILLPQLFERKFLKPVWKTVYDYKSFEDISLSDGKLNKRVYDELIDNKDKDKAREYRGKVVSLLLEKFKVEHGEIFFIIRSNKFYYSTKNSEFYIYVNDNENKLIYNLLPQKDYSRFKNISFYLFIPEGLDKEKVKKELIEIIKSNEFKSLEEPKVEIVDKF